MIKPNERQFLIDRTVDKMTENIVKDYGLSLSEALKTVYQSNCYDLLTNPASDMFVQSPSYVYEILRDEIDGRNSI